MNKKKYTDLLQKEIENKELLSLLIFYHTLL